MVLHCTAMQIEKATHEAKEGSVLLCENLRFHIEETGKAVGKDEKKSTVRATKEQIAAFSRGLSALGDVFVFEAFGAAHRPHASIAGVDCPQRVAGLLMKREMNYYAQVLGAPQRPFLAIIGGAKVSDKIQVIENLLGLVNEMVGLCLCAAARPALCRARSAPLPFTATCHLSTACALCCAALS